MPKVSHEKLLERAKAAHGGRYSYLGFEKREGERFQRIRAVCKEHGEFSQNVSDHIAGKGCKRCSCVAINAKKAHSVGSVEKKGREFGFDYIYKEIRRDKPLQPDIVYTCPRHGEVVQNLYNHLAGKGCPGCAEGSLRHTFETAVKSAKEVHGETYSYLSLTYEPAKRGGNDAIIEYLCKDHGNIVQKLNVHLLGSGCRQCADILRGLDRTLPDDLILEKCNELGDYKAVRVERSNDYVGYKVVASCEKHGEFTQFGYNRLAKQSCPKCANLVSKMNLEIHEWLLSLGERPELEVSLSKNKLKWDVVLPDKKLAIEMNGIYWHSTEYRSPSYHLMKHKLALSKGFRSIQIYDDEWACKKEIVKKHILSAIERSSEEKVSARKCSIEKLTAQEAREFFDKNHIQGFSAGTDHLCLKFENKIVAAATFYMKERGRGSRLSKVNCELTRYATAASVRGGLGKLIAYARAELNFKVLTTFSDIRFFEGNVYKTLGFTKINELRPDYFYAKSGKRVHKATLQKSAIERKSRSGSIVFRAGMTESELAALNGYEKVYDCGKLVWQKVFE